jgi:hypothetical protein
MKGQLVCRMHGGSTPVAVVAGKVRQQEDAIRRTLGKLGYDPIHDPLTELSDLAGEAVAWKRQAAEQVAALEEMSRDNVISGSEEIRVVITVFERAMDRCLAVLATMAKLDIDNRLARISEQRAAAMAEVLRKVFADPTLGLTAEQRATAPTIVRKYLPAA